MSEKKDKQKCEKCNNETTKLSLALTSVNEAWCTLRDGIYNAAITVFGKSVKKNVDWFEENSLTLSPLVTALLAFKTCPSTSRENLARRKMQTEVRKCAHSYWLDLCDDIQKAADMCNTRRMHEGLKCCIGPVKRAVAPLKGLYGNILRGKQQIQFPKIRPQEMTANQLKFISADEELLSKIHRILLLCWQKEDVPQDLKDARFIQLYKSKGDRSVCDNYISISLLNIIGKIYCRILLPKLQLVGENI